MRRGGPLRRALVALAVLATGLVAAPQAGIAAPTGYVTMSDGVSIAVNVKLPPGCDADSPCPAIFEMSGYDGGSAQGGTLSYDYCRPYGGSSCPLQGDSRSEVTKYLDAHYATIHASVRGSGCSGGEFDLFSSRIALDGYELIEWIADQPWSNGDVGIIGHSYGGITGFMVAATQPPSLKAASLSGLIDDLYRGITYPGGVSNYGFPLLWTAGIRTAYDLGGGLAPGLVRPAPEDPDGVREGCARNAATKSRTVLNDPIVQGVNDTDNDWWRARALATHADDIAVPIIIDGAYQDEQTGPRGFTRLYEMVSGVPKRLVITNGDHGTAGMGVEAMRAERIKWLDHWLRGVDNGYGDLEDDHESVTTLLEMNTASGPKQPRGRIDSDRFPLEQTEWQDWYLGANGSLGRAARPAGEAPDAYVSGSPRQAWSYQAGYGFGPPFTTSDGPDELTYKSAPMEDDSVVVGPITANLFISSTAPDTELFVSVADEWTEGGITYRNYVQRGLLKASHRAIDAHHSDCVDATNVKVPCTSEDAARVYRPHRPHTNPTLIQPGQVNEYLVEVFPVGHVFRAGHRIVIKVHTPPAVDSYYAYVPKRPAGINTLYHDASRPSRVTLPMVPFDGDLGAPVPCGKLDSVRCVRVS